MVRWLHVGWATLTVSSLLFGLLVHRCYPLDVRVVDPGDEAPGTAAASTKQATLTASEREGLCTFFKQGENKQVWWGREEDNLCATKEHFDYFDKAERNCIPCDGTEDICSKPQKVVFHQFISKFPYNWEAILLSIKSFLLTQDLTRSVMYLWVNDYNILDHAGGREFLLSVHEFVKLKRVHWDVLIKGTPIEYHAFFASQDVLLSSLPIAPYTDVLRLLLLWTYGGGWVDNDLILLRDWYPLLFNVGLQFIPRWANNHVLHFHKNASTIKDMLDFASTFPFNHPDKQPFEEKMQEVCVPLGYFQVSPQEYGYADVYNTCVLYRTLAANHTDSGKLYEYPLGWFDPTWSGCYNGRHTASDSDWYNVQSRYYGLHTRWPKMSIYGDPIQPNSSLDRCINILTTYFRKCTNVACVPKGAAFLTHFEG